MESKMKTSNQRMHSCAVKRQKIQMHERARKRFLVKKWDIIKEKRKEMIEIQRHECEKRRAARHLWKVNNMQKVLKAAYRVYKKHKFEVMSHDIIVASAARIFLQVKKRLKNFHPNIVERTKIRAQQCLKFMGECIRDQNVAKSTNVSSSLTSRLLKISSIKQAFYTTSPKAVLLSMAQLE
jgi:hypothetical protein